MFKLIVVPFLLVVAITCISISAYFLYKELGFRSKVKYNKFYTIQAVCTEIRSSFNRLAGVVYYSVYQYCINGVNQVYVSSVASNRPRYNIGEYVPLYMDTETGKIYEQLTSANAFRGILIGGIGLFFCVFALIVGLLF